MQRNRNGYLVERYRRGEPWPTAEGECVEEACGRTAYREGRCKLHADLADYKTGRYEPLPDAVDEIVDTYMARQRQPTHRDIL